MTADPPVVLVLHGPNLNMLGRREPGLYGTLCLEEIDRGLAARGRALGLTVETFQSNHEGALVDRLQAAVGAIAGLVINPAAYTHTSVALRDAVLLHSGTPVVEVHLSNIHAREPFRRTSLLSDVVTGQVCGLGPRGYRLALEAVAELLKQPGDAKKKTR